MKSNWCYSSTRLENQKIVRIDLKDGQSLEDCIDSYLAQNVFNRSFYGHTGQEALDKVFFYELDDNGDIVRELCSLKEARRFLKVEEL